MDEELRQCAALALSNAFWTDFSALCNQYIAAHRGLDVPYVKENLQELTSVFGRDTKAKPEGDLNIWTQQPGKSAFARAANTTGWDTLAEALAHPEAIEVHMRGKKIFERVNGEWVLCQNY